MFHLFHASCTWNRLVKLNVAWTGNSNESQETFGEEISSYYLQSVVHLSVSNDEFFRWTTCWQKLQKLCVIHEHLTLPSDPLTQIADAVERGVFPTLHTVCLQPYRERHSDYLKDSDMDYQNYSYTLKGLGENPRCWEASEEKH